MPNKKMHKIRVCFILCLSALSLCYGGYSYSKNNSIAKSSQPVNMSNATSEKISNKLNFFESIEKGDSTLFGFKENEPVGGFNIYFSHKDNYSASVIDTWCENAVKVQTLMYSGDSQYMGVRTYKYNLSNCKFGVIKYNSKVDSYDVPLLDFYILYPDGNTVEFNNLAMTNYNEELVQKVVNEFCTCYNLPLNVEELLTLTDLKGNNSLLQDNSLKTADGTTPEKYFEFDTESGTILEYRSKDVNAPTDVVIPDTIAGVSVKRIGSKAFYKYFDTNGITSVVLPDSITRIDDQAFLANSKLTTIKMPCNLKYLGDSAFQGCSALTQIDISGSVSEVSACAFKDCVSLQSVSLPDSITIISRGAFQNCVNLTSVTGEFNLAVIDSWAFSGTHLTKTSIDAETVADDAFN